MKSVLVSFLMFAFVLGAMFTGVFDLLASPYIMVFAVICVVAALFFALKILGNPFATGDDKNDEETD